MFLIATDIRELCEQFVRNVRPEFNAAVNYALSAAHVEAQKAAEEYNIANPF